jgi:hypothetical protein
MNLLRALLSWNASARDPVVAPFLFLTVGFLVFLFTVRPRFYLPLLLFTAPIPKLFALTEYTTQDGRENAAGFSIADLVLAAGMLAILFRAVRLPREPQVSRFKTAMVLWSASVALSAIVGLAFWPGVYQPSNLLYVARYLVTLAAFPVAVHYAMSWRSERGTRKLLQWLTLWGNITIGLGIVYYFTVGGASNFVGTDMLWNEAGTVFRNYTYFFDYGIDMGYYAVTIAILNVMMISDRPDIVRRAGYGVGLILCIMTTLFLGERVNVLVITVALGYYLLITANARQRSVRTNVVFQVTCLIAVLVIGGAVLRIVAPQQILDKFDAVVTADFTQSSIEVMSLANVPRPIIDLVTSLPIGDFTVRVALSIASLWFFFAHPMGTGFWGQGAATGWWAHHELVTVLVEQSIPGLMALLYFIFRLKQLLWMRRSLHGPGAQLGVLLKSVSVAFFVALIAANTVLLDLKFAMVYWSLVGLWSVLPRVATAPSARVVLLERNAVTS